MFWTSHKWKYQLVGAFGDFCPRSLCPTQQLSNDMEEDTEHAESQDQSPAELDLNFSFQVANTAEV